MKRLSILFSLFMALVLSQPAWSYLTADLQKLLSTKSCPGCDLKTAPLSEINLRQANLRGADLSGAWMRGTDLTEADLTEADLTNADLTRADLTRADLWIADLAGANLAGSNLTGADLTSSYLAGASLSGADLTGAILRKVDLGSADLNGADLTGADLTWAILREADLEGADLNGADLTGANLTSANPHGRACNWSKFLGGNIGQRNNSVSRTRQHNHLAKKDSKDRKKTPLLLRCGVSLAGHTRQSTLTTYQSCNVLIGLGNHFLTTISPYLIVKTSKVHAERLLPQRRPLVPHLKARCPSDIKYCFDPDIDLYYPIKRSFCHAGDVKISKQEFDNKRLSENVANSIASSKSKRYCYRLDPELFYVASIGVCSESEKEVSITKKEF